ncbi:MAG TPA: hypothetical protein VF546_01105 [Pyrinomonadaceae bacterium]
MLLHVIEPAGPVHAPATSAPGAGGAPSQTCQTPASSSSTHSTTRAAPSVPVSCGCPPPVG